MILTRILIQWDQADNVLALAGGDEREFTDFVAGQVAAALCLYTNEPLRAGVTSVAEAPKWCASLSADLELQLEASSTPGRKQHQDDIKRYLELRLADMYRSQVTVRVIIQFWDDIDDRPIGAVAEPELPSTRRRFPFRPQGH